jgi:hypothetical protein
MVGASGVALPRLELEGIRVPRLTAAGLLTAILASSAAAAPALKDKDDWLDEVISQPPEKLPWKALDRYVEGKEPKDWLEDGFRLNHLLTAKAKKLGWNAPFNDFTLVEDGKKRREDLSPTALSSALLQWKWWELHNGKPATLIPKVFRETGRGK